MLKVYPFLTFTHSCQETFTRRIHFTTSLLLYVVLQHFVPNDPSKQSKKKYKIMKIQSVVGINVLSAACIIRSVNKITYKCSHYLLHC